MAVTIYNQGLDEMRDFVSGTYRFLLLKSGYAVDRDHDFVSALTPASNEISVAGYSRQTAASKTRTVDDTNDRITYDCADPNFGTLAAGETVVAMVLYRFVTNDADSPLIAYYPLGSVATAGLPFTVQIGTAGLLYVKQG